MAPRLDRKGSRRTRCDALEDPRGQERVLVARVWHEPASPRARLTTVDLAEVESQRTGIVASPDEMLRVIREWLQAGDDVPDEHG